MLAGSSFIIPGVQGSLSGDETPLGTERNLAVRVEVEVEALWIVKTQSSQSSQRDS